jgi:mRNA-degrading endonuclease RelE of RelBE toxin-antitoxin system
VGKRLRPPLADGDSARRGTYRVIDRIDQNRNTVTVTVVGVFPRSDAYRA